MKQDERKICPAIWIDDGIYYENQPKNIQAGYVVFGIHIVDIFYRRTRKNTFLIFHSIRTFYKIKIN